MLGWIIHFAIQGVFVFLICLAYEDAVQRGIRNARDEHHRMTPLSPWHFFMRGFGPSAAWIGIAAIPGLFCGAYLADLSQLISQLGYPDWGLLFAPDFLLLILRYGMPSTGTSSLGSCALITLAAPRFEDTGIGAFLATAIVMLIRICLHWLVRARIWNWDSMVVLGVGIAAFVLTWLYVRFKLDRAWFRFEG